MKAPDPESEQLPLDRCAYCAQPTTRGRRLGEALRLHREMIQREQREWEVSGTRPSAIRTRTHALVDLGTETYRGIKLGEVCRCPRRGWVARRDADLPDSRTLVLYRLWDRHHRLLYVGISRNVRERIKSHRKKQPWADLIELVTFDPEFDAERELLDAERVAIQTEHPAFNLDIMR